ncbi:hypothetical protein P43SY_003671 [Pythium insidiosum]|uniref:IgA peptidase M64-domain-containing protein n=1 Tax=Pythium insidiosum TaxID=114742 RepID=A0AAD5LBW3_PYTIN|nr:hypothetical protein P43SY_003671 [Pythium insidiosum]
MQPSMAPAPRSISALLLRLLLLLLLLLCNRGAASQQTQTQAFATTLLLRSSSSACVELEPIAETQRHRAIRGPDDAVERFKHRTHELGTGVAVGQDQIVEIIGGSVAAVQRLAQRRCPRREPASRRHRHRALRSMSARADVRKLVDSGNPANRLDLVFMGDGYTESEKDRFFGDIQRLTGDVFSGDTFAPYLPLFNVWAAFVPSVDSGIGLDGRPKNTAFRLYRDNPQQLRGIWTDDAQAARDVCQSIGPQACDFPALIANDDFYGGTGGEFVISTRSKTSGPRSLRHEFGHNFGRVGEEYDGGQVYVGANSAPSLANVTWKHWLTHPSRLVEEKMAQLYEKRMWHDLAQGPLTISFTSSGEFKRRRIGFSLTGVRDASAMTVSLDGEALPWTASGIVDRSFYEWTDRDAGFGAGSHQLVFEGVGPFNGPVAAVVCNVEVFEFMGEDEFRLDDPEYIGIYPTFDIDHVRSYRPSHEKCLMRNVTSLSFCSVCKENLWLQLMERIEFIDDVVTADGKVVVQVIPLGQRREPNDTFVKTNASLAAAERYSVSWFQGPRELTEFRDRFEISTRSLAAGEYTVRVNLTTPTVRSDPLGYMQSSRSFRIRGDGSMEPARLVSGSPRPEHCQAPWLLIAMGLVAGILG